MPAGSPGADLLIVGGLTIDRLADGTLAPGGSVLHATRALHRQASIDVLTMAGDEPMAQAGLTELRLLARRVVCLSSPRTIAFRHDEAPGGRRLWLEPVMAAIRVDDPAAGLAARSILFAPVAGEIGPELLAAWGERPVRGAILQGWLRSVGAGGEVTPLSVANLSDDLRSQLSRCDVLLASREDLRAESPDPARQLGAMRRRFPGVRLVAVTDGPRGVWIDLADGGRGRRWNAPVPRLVRPLSDVGAGDVFAAALTLTLPAGEETAVERALEAAAAWLETRNA